MSERPQPTGDDAEMAFDADTAAPGAAGTSAQRAQPKGGHQPQLDPASEENLWSGRASWKSIIPTLLIWVVVTLVVAIGLQLIFHSVPATLTGLGLCGVLLLLLLARAAWQIWSMSYRLTSQRLFVRRGILSQTVDQTELLRVDDVRVRQTIIQRMLGLGQVEVISSDRSDAKLVLRDILNPETVSEHVRRHTRTLQRRTLFMEQL
jgi:uncharacterized membrane protein YdbT with pleckstrin-like domain